jgi:hypothetical protein
MTDYDPSSSASQWREAHEHWRKINIAGQMGTWDGMYGLIVASKENSIADKQRLVSTVKEFVTAYKTEPTQERVDAMLKFFRKFIGQILERCDVAEKGFLTFYHTFSLVTDPAELFLAAHTEMLRQQRALTELNSAVLGLKLDNERLAAQRMEAEATLKDLHDNSDAPSALKQQLASLQDTVSEMQSEKKILAQMLRAAEIETAQFKADVGRLTSLNSSLQDALGGATAKVDEVVIRSERDASRLLAEVEESSGQIALLQDELERLRRRISQPEAPSHLSTELAAMHQLCARLEASCAASTRALDDERQQTARLAAELAAASKAAADRKPMSKLKSELDSIDPLALVGEGGAPAPPSPSSESVTDAGRRRIRDLERELLSQRLELAEAREQLRASNGTVESLRKELAVLSEGSPTTGAGGGVAGAGEGDAWDTAFGEPASSGRPTVDSKGLLSESDFAELLADEHSKGTTAESTESFSTTDGEESYPNSGSSGAGHAATLVAALLAQRGVLKKRLLQAEMQLASSRVEFQKSRSRCEQLMADNALLLARGVAHPLAGDNDGGGAFKGEKQLQLLLQEKRAVGGHNQLHASSLSGTVAVTVDGTDPFGAPLKPPPGHRRAVVSQKIFSIADHVAMVIANMLVFNRYTRAFVVFLFSLAAFGRLCCAVRFDRAVHVEAVDANACCHRCSFFHGWLVRKFKGDTGKKNERKKK